MNDAEFNDFVDGYVNAMLFSSIDDDGEPLDKYYGPGDVDSKSMERIEADCRRFLDSPDGGGMMSLVARLQASGQFGHKPGSDDDTLLNHAGRDFYYTRNGYGCGFWDGDWAAEPGSRMDKLAKQFSESNPHIGEDGLIHVD